MEMYITILVNIMKNYIRKMKRSIREKKWDYRVKFWCFIGRYY